MIIGCLFFTAGHVFADDAIENDPSGTWVWETEVDGETIESRLSVSLNGKKLRGTYRDQNVTEKIKNAKFDGKTMTFDLEFEVDGTEVKASFKGAATGDKLTGKANLSLDGQENTIEIKGVRKTRTADVVGSWKLDVETGDGESFSPTVTLKTEKRELSGTYQGPVAGKHDLKEISLKDNVLAFTVAGVADSDGSAFEAKFEGIPRGNFIKAKADVTINGVETSAKISGKRTPVRNPDRKKKEKK